MSKELVCSAENPYIELRPDDGTWTAPLVFSLFALPIHFALWRCAAEKLGKDLLQHCRLMHMKETICKAYEVTSVTTALVMTTIAGLLVEGHEITPNYFCLNDDFAMHLRQIYVTLCLYCLQTCSLCVILCCLNFFYLNSLTNTDVVNFLYRDHAIFRGLGQTMVFLMESYILFALAVGIWAGASYGFMPFVITSFLTIGNVYVVGGIWTHLSKYNPSDPKHRKKVEIAEPVSTTPVATLGAKVVQADQIDTAHSKLWGNLTFSDLKTLGKESGAEAPHADSESSTARGPSAPPPSRQSACQVQQVQFSEAPPHEEDDHNRPLMRRSDSHQGRGGRSDSASVGSMQSTGFSAASEEVPVPLSYYPQPAYQPVQNVQGHMVMNPPMPVQSVPGYMLVNSQMLPPAGHQIPYYGTPTEMWASNRAPDLESRSTKVRGEAKVKKCRKKGKGRPTW